MSRSENDAQCDYCGLPVVGQGLLDDPVYCCSGCRFAAAVMQGEGNEVSGAARAMLARLGLAIFFSMNVMVFTFFLWSEQSSGQNDSSRVLFELARYVCLLLSTPVLILLGRPLVEDAARELRKGRASLNLLLMTGVLASFLYSAYSVFSGRGHVYFEVGCMVLVAITLGRWLEASGKLKTTAELRKLQQLLPDVVRRILLSGEETVPLGSVQLGDNLRFLPGETIAVDGQITRGEAAIDECMVTGESTPIRKQCGETVYSGTTNLDGELCIRVTSPPGAGTIERLVEAVLQAVQGRTRLERLAERIASCFLPAVLVIAFITFAWHTLNTNLGTGILNALAVVVIACPCALGLATPMALWAAIGNATRRHVLVQDGDAFCRLASATVICFDKTGTLTHGCEVTQVCPSSLDDQDALLGIALALARTSHHPLSEAIVRYAEQAEVVPTKITSVQTIAGRGVCGVCDHSRQEVVLGNATWLRSLGIDTQWDAEEPSSLPDSRVFIGCDGQLLGSFSIRQRVRQTVTLTFHSLRELGFRIMILSGDSRSRVEEVAQDWPCEIAAPLLPEEKLKAIRDLQAAGQVVVMVGDGLNDAPALAAADVGIALGCGADVSRWSGNLCLLNDELATLPALVELSRRTTRTIRWNLLWAFGYNVIGIPLAALGWLHPAMAAGAMVVSSLMVVSNSLQLASAAHVDQVRDPHESDEADDALSWSRSCEEVAA